MDSPEHCRKILAHPARVLDQTEREFFFDNGYVIKERAISPDWIARLNDALARLIDKSRELTRSDGTYDLETGESSVLIEAPWDVSYVAYSPSGRYRVSGVNADARTEVTLVDTSTGQEVELPELPPGDLRNVRFSATDPYTVNPSSLSTTRSSSVALKCFSAPLGAATTLPAPKAVCMLDAITSAPSFGWRHARILNFEGSPGLPPEY